jgi:hypothetical protein
LGAVLGSGHNLTERHPRCEIGEPFSQSRCEGEEENNEPGSQSEAVRQIEGLLGCEEVPQEVTLRNFHFSRTSGQTQGLIGWRIVQKKLTSEIR